MASLDAARHQAVQLSTWNEPIKAASRIREGICTLPGIGLFCASEGVCLPTLFSAQLFHTHLLSDMLPGGSPERRNLLYYQEWWRWIC